MYWRAIAAIGVAVAVAALILMQPGSQNWFPALQQQAGTPEPKTRMHVVERLGGSVAYQTWLIRVDGTEYVVNVNGGIIKHETPTVGEPVVH